MIIHIIITKLSITFKWFFLINQYLYFLLYDKTLQFIFYELSIIMLFRYYSVLLMIWWAMIAIGQARRSIVPLIGIWFVALSHTTIYQRWLWSLHDLIQNNIMLLSRLWIAIGVIWLGSVTGQVIVVSIITSLVTVWAYHCALLLTYKDGIHLWYTSSYLITIITSITIIMACWAEYGRSLHVLQYAIWIITIKLVLITTIWWLYWLWFSHNSQNERYHHSTCIILIWYLIPIGIIYTLLWNYPIIAWLLIVCQYGLYWLWLRYLHDNDTRYLTQQPELTIDLILKWYKTTYINQLMTHRYIESIAHQLEQILPSHRTLIQLLLDSTIGLLYMYMIWTIRTQWIGVREFGWYIILIIWYIGLHYLYRTQSYLSIDTIAQGYIVTYLSIGMMMMLIFAWDIRWATIIWWLWTIINSILSIQYRQLSLDHYITTTHLQRRIRSNSVSWAMIAILSLTLPIDPLIKLPIILIIRSILGFVLVQSHMYYRRLDS